MCLEQTTAMQVTAAEILQIKANWPWKHMASRHMHEWMLEVCVPRFVTPLYVYKVLPGHADSDSCRHFLDAEL